MTDADTEVLRDLRNDLAAALRRIDALISPPSTPRGEVDATSLPRTQAIELVLERSQRPMRPVEIWAELRRLGRSKDPKMEVQVTTFDLWQRGRIAKLGRGSYAAKSSVAHN